MPTSIGKAQKALIKIEQSAKANASYAHTVCCFLEKYIICEYCYKVLLKEYRIAKEKDSKPSSLNINVQEIKKVLSFAGITISDQIIDAIFSSNDKNGQRSAKKLRDNIVHQLHDSSLRESVDRFEELSTAMKLFTDSLRYYPIAEADIPNEKTHNDATVTAGTIE